MNDEELIKLYNYIKFFCNECDKILNNNNLIIQNYINTLKKIYVTNNKKPRYNRNIKDIKDYNPSKDYYEPNPTYEYFNLYNFYSSNSYGNRKLNKCLRRYASNLRINFFKKINYTYYVNVIEYMPPDEYGYIHSYNCNYRSFEFNNEIDAIIFANDQTKYGNKIKITKEFKSS